MKRSQPLVRRTPLRAKHRRNDSSWRTECLARRGAWCRACGSSRDLQSDHLIPRSQGGPSIVENGLILGGPFGCGCHDRKTAHQLLIQRAWLDPDQLTWLEQEGHATWGPDGVVSGKHCRLFADETRR